MLLNPDPSLRFAPFRMTINGLARIIIDLPFAHFSINRGLSKSMIATYICAVCGEEIETVVDESQGLHQEYIEDCAVCCRPNVLRERSIRRPRRRKARANSRKNNTRIQAR